MTRRAVVAKKAKTPSLSAWLHGDTTYQGQVTDYNRAYADWLSGEQLKKQQNGTVYSQNIRDLGTTRKQGFSDLKDDYASRGVLQSGLYGKGYSDLSTDYDRRQADLSTGLQDFNNTISSEIASQQGTLQTSISSAKNDAALRRATKYNLKG